jgi:CheY-like chemotaxis protein/two-component sensor histidine kinase
VDDILTISKLDSHLLLITPMPVQPIQVVSQTLKMFNTEVQMSDIEMQFIVDDSYLTLDAGIVMLDSSRLRQVIVNLVTNSIKFTKSETRQRSIIISLSAHAEPPAIGPKDFKYFPTEKSCPDVTIGDDWGQGPIIYLRFEVKDSGCGLTEEEKKNLFTRYSQASPKTHVKYGGSGLGLFISRQLTELQGGEIGVASEAGVGSTFAFYIKSRRAIDKDARLLHEKIHVGPQVLNIPSKPSASRVSSAPASMATIASLGDNSPSKWHILIVEDNLVNQKVLAKGIKKLGCTVHVANHGGEALELLQETRHYRGREDDGKDLTVILMDLEMPVMDGLTCVRKIRGLEKDGILKAHLPIIAVTANARSEQVLAARDSGMVSPTLCGIHPERLTNHLRMT